jgi:hypothetical protein
MHFVPEGAAPHLHAARRTFEQHKCLGMVARIDHALATSTSDLRRRDPAHNRRKTHPG